MFNVAIELPQYGDLALGFYGEVSTGELVDGEELAALCYLKRGDPQCSQVPWLKYVMDGEVRYVAKKPFRYGVSWQQLHNRGLVFGRTIEIRGKKYVVRLMQGGNAQPTDSAIGYDVTGGVGSEWNRLFYRICKPTPYGNKNLTASEGSPTPWVSYTETDLLMHNSDGNGTLCWTQETHGYGSTYRVVRGFFGISSLDADEVNCSYHDYGWRPVLVPVE